ncbi:MDR family MFS transporter [Streptomyces sp. NPDC046876]|uniref:MDR family MFS transporter n=1 Tax=Streptomyces sp. NPDC046876 TaxID=3155616 RepID=UPI0033E06A19
MEQLITEDPRRIGPYRLIARLGAGGMGLVYLGRSEAGRTVAVKVVQADHAGNPEFRRRFAREVAAARRVGGSWTAAVLDADPEAAVPWVATQYIPGPDLHGVVAEDFGPLPEYSVRTLANRLALALEAVHGAGLIHRDLKPSNVLVTVDGPRVIDFGIARAMDSLAGDSLHTRTGMLIGSPGFMSPEQVRGLPLTPASDVFCLGAVLVYASTGRLLFGAPDTGLNAHLFRVAEEEADLTGVPDALVDLVGACLHKDPDSRPTPREVAERTAGDEAEEWLPGSVLAQLGRHAARLLDYVPAGGGDAGDAGSGSSSGPALPLPSSSALPLPLPLPLPSQAVPPPPAYAQTAPAHSGPGQGFGPPPRAWSEPVAGSVSASAAYGEPHPRRWKGLAAVALAQLTVLMGTANFSWAAPSVQADLGLSTGLLGPLFTVHVLAFGAALLLGGHLADLLGRKRTLAIGLVGYALASVLGGVATVPGVLIGARALQGVFGALLTTAALSLVASGFTGPKERSKAFGVYAAIAGGGSAVGLFAGGWVVEAASWRVSLFAGALLAVIALIGAVVALPHDRPGDSSSGARGGVRPDVPGLLLGVVGLAALLYGLDRLSEGGWSVLGYILLPAPGVLLLAGFLWWQTRSSRPLLPPSVFADRNRLGCLLAVLLFGMGLLVPFTVLPFYVQVVLGHAPAMTGTLFLPLVAAVVIGSTQISARLLPRVAPRVLIVTGLVVTAAGLVLLSDLESGAGTYVTLVLPGMLLTGLGAGLAFTPLFALATSAPDPRRSGGAAAGVTAVQHIGGALGAALVGTLVADRMQHEGLPPAASMSLGLLKAYDDTLWWGAGSMLLAAVVVWLLVTGRSREDTVPPAPAAG